MARGARPSAKEIFLEALETPPEGRSAFLDDACRGDETLRSDVMELLRAHGGAADFLAAPPISLDPGVVMADGSSRRAPGEPSPASARGASGGEGVLRARRAVEDTPRRRSWWADRVCGGRDAHEIQEALRRRIPESATDAETRFFQDRLILFCKTGFFVVAATFVARNLLQAVFASATYPSWAFRPSQGIHLALCLVLGIAWQYSRRRGSPAALRTVDAAITILCCVGITLSHHFTFASGGLVLDRALFFATVILITRALTLPSTAPRTFVLSLLAMVPVVAGSAAMFRSVPRASVVLETSLTAQWALVVVAVSTIASSVIYSLRRRVRKAEQLGHYTLEKKLGEGGMGVVYQARHAMLRRPTAIKLLRPTASDSTSVARFEREVQLTSQLTHPNTIAVYDYGVTPDGIFYYVMEYLPGITLQKLVEQVGPLPEGRTIHILKQVAAALAEAHGIGLIHRDIKPANVILGERGGSYDFVKVLDFGLVKDLHAKQDLFVSGQGILVGTPFYVSPEAIRNPETIDGRSDLYALGAVGYFLLTATTIFRCTTLIEACSHHLHTPVEPPSARLGRSVAPDLERVLMWCLEKNPEKRPADTVALLAALESCSDAARWSQEAARRWWLDHPELASGSAGGAGAMRSSPTADTVPTAGGIEGQGSNAAR